MSMLKTNDGTIKKDRSISFATSLLEALEISMEEDHRVMVMGLGVTDPKGIFGTTLGLKERFGNSRVFDVPVSENALTGVAIGLSMMGYRPVITHQRLDFALLSLDQIINNAAKWHFMFAGTHRAPITIRMVLGRGWGQGPQHSQSLQAIFAHIPGLKVVMPSTPEDAKGLLISSIEDDNPVIFIEHRWLHSMVSHVPKGKFNVPLGKANVFREGRDVTIVGVSYMTHEANRAAEILSNECGIEAEVIDLRTVKPFDFQTIYQSVKKTGHLVVCDTGHLCCGVASEIVASISENGFRELKSAPLRVALPDRPTPTSKVLSDLYYPRSCDIADKVFSTLCYSNEKKKREVTDKILGIQNLLPSDVPDRHFTGPF